MKTRIPTSLRKALIIALGSTVLATTVASGALSDVTTSNLGNVMYIGDSITHGAYEASYRWSFFKLLVDNGIGQIEKGVNTGNSGAGTTVAPGTKYGGRTFANVHSAQSSARAFEVSGRYYKGSAYNRFNYSNITNWLGQSIVKTDGNTYSPTNGAPFTGTNKPDTYFVMLGTNDLLSENAVFTAPANLIGTTSNGGLTWTGVGDMDIIVNSINTSNPSAYITIMSVPVYNAATNGNTQAAHAAIEQYNVNLAQWATWKNTQVGATVVFVDINKGLIDVSSATSFTAHRSMFVAADALHPNAQGNLLIAGNLAKGSGYAGATAGQVRLAATGFTYKTGTNLTMSSLTLGVKTTAAVSETFAWQVTDVIKNGFTIDFLAQVGNGGTPLTPATWNITDNFAVSVGNGTVTGTLNINEAYIQWGSTILYSMDMNTNLESLRVAYTVGSGAEGVASGFYVWLGDMMIGQGLTASAGTLSGATLTYTGAEGIILSNFSMTGGTYSPTTTGYSNTAALFLMTAPPTPAAPEGNKAWNAGPYFYNSAPQSNVNLTVAGDYNARNAVNTGVGASGNSVGVTITSSTAGWTHLYGNKTDYTGDIWLTIADLAHNGGSGWIGAHGGTTASSGGTLTGNANLRFTNTFTTAKTVSTVFGSVNADATGATKGVTGNIYLELSAANVTYNCWTATTSAIFTSVAGVYGNSYVGGDITIVVNEGTLTAAIVGGYHNSSFGANSNIAGSTNIFINGGTIGTSTSTAATGVSIIGGGGGTGTQGQVHGTNITVTGGAITGHIYGTFTGQIVGNVDIKIKGGSIGGDIYAGGTTGNVTGNTTVSLLNLDAITLANIMSSVISGGASGVGSVGGTKAFIADNIHGVLTSRLTNFNTVTFGTLSSVTASGAIDNVGAVNVSGGAVVTLGGAMSTITSINALGASSLTLAGTATGVGTLSAAGASSLFITGTVSNLNSISVASGSHVTLAGGTLHFNTGAVGKTLNVTGNLTAADGSTFEMLMISGTNSWDTIAITGDFNGSGELKFNLSTPNTLANTQYTLLTTTGSLNLDAGTQLTIIGELTSGNEATRQDFSLHSTANSIYLDVVGDAATLTWTGAGNNIWMLLGGDPDTKLDANWTTPTDPDTRFHNFDSVIFGTQATAQTVTLSGVLNPTDVSVTGGDYTFISDGTGKISGTATTLSVTGGTLTLNLSNDFGGTTTIGAGGTLVLGNANALANTSGISINGGTLGITETLSFSNALSKGAGSATIDVATGKSATFSASHLFLNNSFTKQGAGTLAFTNVATGITLGTGATWAVNGGTLALSTSAAGDLTLAGTRTGTGTISAITTGTAILRFNGNGTGFTGTYIAQGTTIILNNYQAIAGVFQFNANCGSFFMATANTNTTIMHAILDLNGKTVNVNGGGSSTYFYDGLKGSGNINIGTWNAGAASMHFAKDVTAFTGNIYNRTDADNTAFFWVFGIANNNMSLRIDAGAIDYLFGDNSSLGNAARAGKFLFNLGTQTFVMNARLIGNAIFEKQGSGIMSINQAPTSHSGAVTITGGRIKLIESGALGGTISIASGAFLENAKLLGTTTTFAQVISGAGQLQHTGTGTTTLSGVVANTYTGGTLVTNGVLNATTAGALGGLGATLNALSISGGTVNISGVQDNLGVVTVSGTGVLNATVAGALGGTTVNANKPTINVTGGTARISGSQVNVGAITVSAGRLEIASTLSLGGSLSLSGTGTLSLGAAPGAALALTVGAFTLNSGTTIEMRAGTVATDSITMSSFTWTGGPTGTVNLNITANTGYGTNGTYLLFTSNGGSGGWGGWNETDLNNYFILGGDVSQVANPNLRQTFKLVFGDGTFGATNQVYLLASGSPVSLDWAGLGDGSWTLLGGTGTTDTNWDDKGGALADSRFHTLDDVTFGSGALAGARTVSIKGDVNPGTITVSATGYVFNADPTVGGKIIGATTTLTVASGGGLTLNLANTYGGGTTIDAGGTLTLNALGGLGTGAVSVAGTLELGYTGAYTNTTTGAGTLKILGGADISIASTLTGFTGNLTVSGGSIAISASQTFTGVNLNGGITTISAVNALGTAGNITFGGGTLALGINSITFANRLKGDALNYVKIDAGSTTQSWNNFGSRHLLVTGGVITITSYAAALTGHMNYDIALGAKVIHNFTGSTATNGLIEGLKGSGHLHFIPTLLSSIINGWQTFTGTLEVTTGSYHTFIQGAANTTAYRFSLIVNGNDTFGFVLGLDAAGTTFINSLSGDGAIRMDGGVGTHSLNLEMMGNNAYSGVFGTSNNRSGTFTVGSASGNYTLTLSNANSGAYSASTLIITNATVEFIGAGIWGGSAGGGISINNANATVKFANDQDVTQARAISGTGGKVIIDSTAVVTFSIANTYTGGTTLKGGVLSISADAHVSSGTVTFNGGTLRLTANMNLTNAFATLAGNAANISIGSGLTGTVTSNTLLAGSLNVFGGGTLLLSTIQPSAAIGNALNTINIGENTRLTLTTTNHTASSFNSVLTGSGTIKFILNSATGTSPSLTVSANNSSFTGTMEFGNAGGTAINNTGIAFASLNAFGGTGSVLKFNNVGFYVANASRQVFNPTSESLQDWVKSTIDVTGTVVINGSSTAPTGGQVAAYGYYGLSGTGTVSLFTNQTYMRVYIMNDLSKFTGTIAAASTWYLGQNTVAEKTGIDNNIFGLNAAVNANVAVDFSNDVTFNATWGGSATFTKLNTNILSVSKANTSSGAVTISAGTLKLVDAGTLGTGTSIVNNGILEIAKLSTDPATILAQVISGTGQLRHTGTGTLTLTGANTYTGGTMIQSGTLNATAAGALGGSATNKSALAVTGGTVNISAAQANLGNTTISNGGAVVLSGTATLGTDTAVAISGVGSSLNLGGLTIGNAITYQGGTLSGYGGYTGNLTVGANGLILDSTFKASATVNNSYTLTLGGVASTTGSMFTLSGLTNSGSVLFDLTGTPTLAVGNYTLLTTTGAFSNSGTFSWTGATVGAGLSSAFNVSSTGTITLSITDNNTVLKVEAGSTTYVDSGNTSTFDDVAGTLNVGGTGAIVNIEGAITDTGTVIAGDGGAITVTNTTLTGGAAIVLHDGMVAPAITIQGKDTSGTTTYAIDHAILQAGEVGAHPGLMDAYKGDADILIAGNAKIDGGFVTPGVGAIVLQGGADINATNAKGHELVIQGDITGESTDALARNMIILGSDAERGHTIGTDTAGGTTLVNIDVVANGGHVLIQNTSFDATSSITNGGGDVELGGTISIAAKGFEAASAPRPEGRGIVNDDPVQDGGNARFTAVLDGANSIVEDTVIILDFKGIAWDTLLTITLNDMYTTYSIDIELGDLGGITTGNNITFNYDSSLTYGYVLSFNADAYVTSADWTWASGPAPQMFLTFVPEPTTATLGMLGLAGLLLRRRRTTK